MGGEARLFVLSGIIIAKLLSKLPYNLIKNPNKR